MDCLNRCSGYQGAGVVGWWHLISYGLGGDGGHESSEATKGMKQLLSVWNLHNIKMLKTWWRCHYTQHAWFQYGDANADEQSLSNCKKLPNS
jgi:hypothetical protein